MPRQVAGVFAYRHLGLAGRNIVLMKLFLPLLLIIGCSIAPKVFQPTEFRKKE